MPRYFINRKVTELYQQIDELKALIPQAEARLREVAKDIRQAKTDLRRKEKLAAEISAECEKLNKEKGIEVIPQMKHKEK